MTATSASVIGPQFSLSASASASSSSPGSNGHCRGSGMTPSARTVLEVAGFDGLRLREPEGAGTHEVVGLEHDELPPHLGEVEPVPVDRRCAGEHAVVVVRITLDLHQPLPTARRAAAEVGVAGRSPVEGLGELLAHPGHRVDAEVSVVPDQHPLEGAVRTEREAAAVLFVAGVRGRSGEAFPHGCWQRARAATGEAAASGAEEAAVPVLKRAGRPRS